MRVGVTLLAFITELIAWPAWGVAAWRLAGGGWPGIIMGLLVVTAVITCWGLWASPKAQQRIRAAQGRTDDDTIPITIAVKIIVFSGAVVLLALAGWWWWAALLAAMIVLLMGLSLVRRGSDTGSADLH